jgi:hypothetical protein
MSLEYISLLEVNSPKRTDFIRTLRTLFDAFSVHHVLVVSKRHSEFELTSSLDVEWAHQVSLEIVFVMVFKPCFLFYNFVLEDHAFLYFGVQFERFHGFHQPQHALVFDLLFVGMHFGPVCPPGFLLLGRECQLGVRDVLHMLEFEVKFGLCLLDAFLFVFQEKSAVFIERNLSRFVDVGVQDWRSLVILKNFVRVDKLSVTTEESTFMEVYSLVEKFSRFFALDFATGTLGAQHDAAHWDLTLEGVSVANVVVIASYFPREAARNEGYVRK